MNLKKKTHKFVEECLDLMFPVRLGLRNVGHSNLNHLEISLLDLLDRNFESSNVKSEKIAKQFILAFPKIKIELEKDLDAIYQGDPAATSVNEIILAYPGFQAVSCFRIAHYFLQQGVSLLPRLITEYAHSNTGTDIHPGANIGTHFCIDHGTGIVIGETTIIGDHVKMYQGVTLGALSIPDRDCCPEKRHPTIGNNVIIYAHAIILGGSTEIGDNSIIGGNVWITKSVPANSKIYFADQRTNSITK